MKSQIKVLIFILSYLFCIFLLVVTTITYAQITSPSSAEIAIQSFSEWIKYNQKHDNKCTIKWDPYTGLPRQIIGHQTQSVPGNPEDIAFDFITRNRPLLQVDPTNLDLEGVIKVKGLRRIKYRQCYKGIPVYGQRLIVVMDEASRVVGYFSNYDPFVKIDLEMPIISYETAEEIALYSLQPKSYIFPKSKGLVIYPKMERKGYSLCWPVEISSQDAGSWLFVIDALTGELLSEVDLRWQSHGHVTGLIFPEHTTDPMIWTPFGGEEIDFGGGISALTDIFWGGYGTPYTGPFTSSLTGPYVSVYNVAAPPGISFTSPEVVEYEWIEIEEPTGIIEYPASACTLIDLDFSFDFYGVSYNQIYIHSCGFLCFSNYQYFPPPSPIPSTSNPNGIIAPYWREFSLYYGGRIIYLCTPDKFVVTWEGMTYYTYEPQTFQAILKADGTIIFQYKDITNDMNTIIGIEDQSGKNGLGYYDFASNFTAVLFSSHPQGPNSFIKSSTSFTYTDAPSSDFTYNFNWHEPYFPIDTGIIYDDWWVQVPLNFIFPFYGAEYSSIYISSNGYIALSFPSAYCIPDPIPSPQQPNNIIAPFWRDLNPSKGGRIVYEMYSDHIIITWEGIPDFYNGEKQTFQTFLYQNGDILFQYKDITGSSKPTSIGIENQTGIIGRPCNGTPINHSAAKLSPSPTDSSHYKANTYEYSWVNTTMPTGITGSNQSKQFTLPFTLDFYGETYDSIYICSNGFLSFTANIDYTPDFIPSPNSPNGIIAPFWRNLNPAAGGNITYSSDPNRFVVTWDHVPNYYSGSPQTFQVLIYKTGDICFQYEEVTYDKKTTIGLENHYGTGGKSVGGDLGVKFTSGDYEPSSWDYIWQETNSATGITGDDQSKEFNLQFTLNFYGQNYNSIYVCSNGFLSFTSNTDWSPDPIPSPNPPNGIIAPFWRDLNPATGGNITYLSDPNRFVVTWDHVPNYYSGSPQTFQAIILKSGDIIFQYKEIYFDTPSSSTSTSTGIENQSGTQGSPYFFPLIKFYPRHYTSLTWGFPETNIHADEVNAFYHVNLVHDYIHKTLGMDNDPNYTQVKVNVYDTGDPQYDPAIKTIRLSDDPNNIYGPARESDIIYHEYTHFFEHSIYGQDFINFDNQLNRHQYKAIAEGYADYFACSLNDDPNIDFPPQIVEPRRDISEFRRYPDDFTPPWEPLSSPHENGRIISSTFWDIRDGFKDPNVADVDKTDADFLIVRTLLIEPVLLMDISDWLLVLDGIFYYGNHFEMIENILYAHGINGEEYTIQENDYNWEVYGNEEYSNITNDNQIEEVDLNFTFNFYGIDYTSLSVSDNGFVCFDVDQSNPSSPNPLPIPNVEKPNAIIAPLWADFDPIPHSGLPSQIKYLNDSNKFIVTWSLIIYHDPIYGTYYYSFQIILYETGNIVFNYSLVPDNVQKYSHTIGIEDDTGTKGITYLDFLTNGYSLKFCPN